MTRPARAGLGAEGFGGKVRAMRFLPVLAVALASFNAIAAPPDDAGKRLHAFFDQEWEWRLNESPQMASQMGDRRANDRWDDRSLPAVERRHQHAQDALKRLSEIPRAGLSEADQINYDLFEDSLQRQVEGHRFALWLAPVSQRGGPHTADEMASSLRFDTLKDYEDWLARLRAYPASLDQATALMREGIKRRIVQPKVIMQRVPAQLDKQIVGDPADSGFFKPFKRWAAAVPEADRARLAADAKKAITESVIPALRRFKDFFEKEYLPACYDAVGVWQHPEGEAAYAFQARSFTTTPMSPKEIHETGLREVERIRGEMEKVREKVGFAGTLGEFFVHLRTDPKYYYRTGDELLAAYRAMSKETDPLLVKVFRKLPRTPYGVTPIPALIAPDTTTAYYQQPAADGSRAGQYFVNLYKPETRPKWEMRALSLHESVPGHHLQIALAQEQGELPKFRRYGFGYTAYVEGWGLYSESLGNEMGLYEDPYDKFGELTYDMWRAVRLVVDTGMHAFRWDRQKAIDFFLANAPKTEQDVVNEIDRYISWPGQALAYKIGQLKIKELRARAEKELGAKFDLRDWHDHLLASGAVPLTVLEKRMDAWVTERRAR